MKKRAPRLNLVEALERTYATYEAPEPLVLEHDHIIKSLQQREELDASQRHDRQAALDGMFPERTKGSLYQKAPVIEFDF